MTGSDLAQSARALVGTPFRLHGRDPAIGLDCLGVLGAAFSGCGRAVRLPDGYALRYRGLPPTARWAAAIGLTETSDQTVSGDVMMLCTGPGQHHFAIAVASDRMVHAHAGLRRVVEAPISCDWPVLQRWRTALPPHQTHRSRI